MKNPVLKDYTETFFGDAGVLAGEKREEFILRYIPLIKYIAGRLSIRLPNNVTVDDLVSAGVIGLIDASKKFDPGKNILFKTYAEFRIRGAMLDELRSRDWIPRSVRKKMNDLGRISKALERELGRPAEDEEMAEAMGITIEEFHHLLDETKGVTFVDIEMIKRRLPDSSEDDLFDLIADDEASDPFAQLNMLDVKEHLVSAIDTLPEKERLVLSLYYYEELTMKEIGEILGYTESRISQMHSKAVMRIRAFLAERDLGLCDML